MTHEQPEGMYESLHNTAFVKGKEVYLRGMGENGEDISLCAYCAAQCKERCGTDLTDISTEEFGEFMDCECPVSLLYAIAIGAAEMREKLSKFEDTEEKGTGLNALAAAVHENAVAHGWWEKERSFPEIIALIHSELSEALEEFRNGKPLFYYNIDECDGLPCSPILEGKHICENVNCTKGRKPEGVAVELADCIIRILDYCGRHKLDIEEALSIRRAGNDTYSLPELVAACHYAISKAYIPQSDCIYGFAECISLIKFWCVENDIDIDYVIRLKHEYNKSRPYRHGGKKC